MALAMVSGEDDILLVTVDVARQPRRCDEDNNGGAVVVVRRSCGCQVLSEILLSSLSLFPLFFLDGFGDAEQRLRGQGDKGFDVQDHGEKGSGLNVFRFGSMASGLGFSVEVGVVFS